MPDDPLVSVVVAAYRSEAGVARCLDALRAQRFDDFEVVLVNSFPDATGAIVRDRLPSATYVESPVRLLPHAARNAGLAHARGGLLVFTDADCSPDPGWLETLVGAWRSGHEALAGAMGLVPGADRFATGVHLVKFWWALPGLPAGPRVEAPTANAAYSRRLWDRIGPFEGDVFAGDGIASRRASDAGHPAWFVPGARVDHDHHGSLRALWRERHERGREFGRVRIEQERWSRRRAALHALLSPALPLLVLARSLRSAASVGWARRWLMTIDVQAVGQAGWSAGELGAHRAHALGRAP